MDQPPDEGVIRLQGRPSSEAGVSVFRRAGTEKVTVIHAEGTDSESRIELEGHIQPKMGFFAVDAPIYEGDIVLVQDPRGGIDRRLAGEVNVYNIGSPNMRHTEVKWAKAQPVRTAPVRRLSIDGFHSEVVEAAGDLFADGHYAPAILEAFKRVELRVRAQSGLEGTGQDLMARAFHGDPAPIDVRVEAGQSGQDEQEGFRFLFMGAARGIRNPKAHEAVSQLDPQRALEYLALASLLLRRIDDAQARRSN
jgi:uncharacterized protein (TIGR02391 family)